MAFIQMIVLAFSLAMDAFAVAMCKGACLSELEDQQEGLMIGISFGFFQGAMPLLGWLLGSTFKHYIEQVDHFIAFGLLALIGGKLVLEAVKSLGEPLVCKPLKWGELLILGVATSIDALAAGIAMTVMDLNIWLTIGLIALVTFILSYLGVKIGRKFGAKYQFRAQLAGGITLVLIGVKVLVEHLAA